MLLAKRKKKRTIVFVCTGNTCRSPMAQGLLQQYLEENGITTVEVRTAGVMTIPGLLPTPEAVQVMDSAGIDIRKHRSAPLTPEMIRKADLVLGMTPFHVQFALRLADDARNKTFLLKEYAKSDLKNYQISDPMGATLEVYKRVFREIKLAIDKLSLMDCIHAPLDQELKHEVYTPPTPPKKEKAAAAPPPEAEAKPAAAKAAKKSPAKKAAPKAKKTEDGKAPAKKASAKKPAAKKPAPKKTAKK
jgi:protein-tyrosine-phosphatase